MTDVLVELFGLMPADISAEQSMSGIKAFIAQLRETQGSTALRESFTLWPAIEAAHVMSIMLFAGTIFMVDLRLLGVTFRHTSFKELSDRILPLTIAGFVILVITGAVLFYSKPIAYYYSLFFRLKMILIALALINIFIFHRILQRNAHDTDTQETIPPGARLSALLSLSLWVAVIIAGRMIAYDWFPCERLEPDSLLYNFEHCPVVTIADLED